MLAMEREQAVWDRVSLAQEPPRPSITADQLLDWACHECQDACLYRWLARCLPKCAEPWLKELACDEQSHAKRLAAQYYLATGCRPKLCSDFTPTCQPLEHLRRRYQEELAGSNAYFAAAQNAEGELQELLDCLARDEARHARMVMCVLECIL